MKVRLALAFLLPFLIGALPGQQRACFKVPLRELVEPEKVGEVKRWDTALAHTMAPYALLEGSGEASFRHASLDGWNAARSIVESGELCVRAPAGQDVVGRLFVPKADLSGMLEVPFRIAKDKGVSGDEAGAEFLEAQQERHFALLSSGVPGGAWWRHRSAAVRELQGLQPEAGAFPLRPAEDSMDMFTGGRALAENLQLDRSLRIVDGGEPTLDVAAIKGLEVKELDWKKRLPEKPAAIDVLAGCVPHDQHVALFPTFQSLITLCDETDRGMTPLLQVLEPRAEDARVAQRYERQLCLSTSGLGRMLGPHLIESVAITGADPYLRIGADVAVLFLAKDGAGLEKLVATQAQALARSDTLAKAERGEVSGVKWSGVRSPDRRISSYVARLANVVVVTNSLAQLERIVAVQQKKAQALAELPELAFFRSRYPGSGAGETAFLLLSDATIRRWCSARWRIADSRRTRALALLAELHCKHVKEVAAASDDSKPIGAEEDKQLGPLVLERSGIRSERYGSLEFATPILELDTAKVSEAEKDAYERWREQYSRYWKTFFDPIAISLSLGKEKIVADMTVMPLIATSDYAEFMQITKGAKLRPEAVDAHDALATFTIAISPESKPVQQFAGFVTGWGPDSRGPKLDLLGWLGSSFTLHADDDPFWGEMAKAKDPSKFLDKNWHRLPLVVQIESKSAIKLTAFLAALRAAIDGVAPGMTEFEKLDHQGQGYVRIRPSAETRSEQKEVENLSVYYAASGEALVLTLNEDALKKALERRAARRAARAESKPLPVVGKPLLGESVCLQVEGAFVEPWRLASGEMQRDQLRALCWGNLPILNEWHRMFPNEDPVGVHERLFTTRLVDPAGGQYVWNAKVGSMESTVLGCPAAPRKGPEGMAVLEGWKGGNFGLTFEPDGLRARAELERK